MDKQEFDSMECDLQSIISDVHFDRWSNPDVYYILQRLSEHTLCILQEVRELKTGSPCDK